VEGTVYSLNELSWAGWTKSAGRCFFFLLRIFCVQLSVYATKPQRMKKYEPSFKRES